MAGDFLTRTGGNGRRRGGYQPISEINVTPFVDVMLVLLIVFMITAPLLTVGVPIELPKTEAKSIAESEEPLVITVNAEGLVFIQDTEVEIENLVARLKAITESKADTRIYVRGDKNVKYGRVMEVMGTINVAGFTRVAMITERPKRRDRKKLEKKSSE